MSAARHKSHSMPLRMATYPELLENGIAKMLKELLTAVNLGFSGNYLDGYWLVFEIYMTILAQNYH
jgi:hypothetical protein